MSADALGAKRREAGAHHDETGRANSRSDLTEEKGFDEVRASAGRELNQREHHREKQSGEEPKSHTRKWSLVDVDVGLQDAPRSWLIFVLCHNRRHSKWRQRRESFSLT
jgi:hypothetical protein